MKTCRDLLIEKLREIGADGVCCEDCGCGFDNFASCGEYGIIHDCVPAKKIIKGGDECKKITVTWLSDDKVEECFDTAIGHDCTGCYTPMEKQE
jgi:hypothetical protein